MHAGAVDRHNHSLPDHTRPDLCFAPTQLTSSL
jgi:hypothetical protein